ncbi:MAG: phosphatidylserine synthase [Verrucomicrobiae bacterium]|nr:phosphatidylserine synthase [Verrucomicrobiae bacterium]NNJ87111.1 phosphatidylserine synthase [Akkermansiaceae bacterium]
MTELILNENIHQRVITELIPQTRKFLWIITADIKDMHVAKGKRFVPFLEIISDLVQAGIATRLFHAKEPGPRFRENFDKYPSLLHGELFERILCPRIHTKAMIVDGTTAFIGSANLTGAGMGAKNPNKRNFEAGFLTNEDQHLKPLLEWADALYLGDLCRTCQRRDYCPDPIA